MPPTELSLVAAAVLWGSASARFVAAGSPPPSFLMALRFAGGSILLVLRLLEPGSRIGANRVLVYPYPMTLTGVLSDIVLFKEPLAPRGFSAEQSSFRSSTSPDGAGAPTRRRCEADRRVNELCDI